MLKNNACDVAHFQAHSPMNAYINGPTVLEPGSSGTWCADIHNCDEIESVLWEISTDGWNYTLAGSGTCMSHKLKNNSDIYIRLTVTCAEQTVLCGFDEQTNSSFLIVEAEEECDDPNLTQVIDTDVSPSPIPFTFLSLKTGIKGTKTTEISHYELNHKEVSTEKYYGHHLLGRETITDGSVLNYGSITSDIFEHDIRDSYTRGEYEYQDGYDAFYSITTPSGQIETIRYFSGGGDQKINAAKQHQSGELITGSFVGTMEFSRQQHIVNKSDVSQFYLVHTDLRHGFKMQGAYGMEASAMEVVNDKIIVSGKYTDGLSFDGSTNYDARGSGYFVAQMNMYGRVEWVKTFETSITDDILSKMIADDRGNVTTIMEYENAILHERQKFEAFKGKLTQKEGSNTSKTHSQKPMYPILMRT